MKKNISDKVTYPDDLDDFTYDLLEGICGKEHMLFERPSTASVLEVDKTDYYGHIDFLSNSGNVVETNYFKDKQSFDTEVSECINVGRPIIRHIDKQFKDQIIDMYSKEFPAIRHISEKTARSIDALNTQNGQPLTIKDIRNAYIVAGKNLEAVPSDSNMDIFDKLKDVSDGLKQAQFLERKEVAQEKTLINPSKTKVLEMTQ
jgi:hypothetical protein